MMNGQLQEAKGKKYMEKFSNSPLEDWINSDSELLKLLEYIDLQAETDLERAKIAFHKLAEKYSLPKYPDDIDDRETQQVADFHLYNPISMYEVLGKIKFADKNPENIKSNVLMAAYLIKNKYEPLIDDELDKYLGDDELNGFGYKGEGIDVEMIPVKQDESWFDKGCVFFTKEV